MIITMQRIFISIIIAVLLAACTPSPKDVKEVASLPEIFPDYIDVTVPAEIAPLNFNVMGDDVEAVEAVVKAETAEIRSLQKGNLASFDIDQWHKLLDANRGKAIQVTVTALQGGKWNRYKSFAINVSQYPLEDYGLTYRRIAPGYEVYSKMGLYQRCLSNFDEEPIIENTVSPGACLNCHTANRTNPNEFTFHVRGQHGATLVQRDGKREWLKARNDSLGGSMVYPYWHPEGKYCAYSTNKTNQAFHSAPEERIEVYDVASDVFVYNAETHELITSPLLSTTEHFETYPAFSPDGKTLYFVSSDYKEIPSEYKDIKYDLCSISFDAATETYGDHVDTLFSASKLGKNMVFPRPSYDGKYIMFTMSDYGCFPIWHKEADLWLLDLATGEARSLDEVNSDDTESFHNWSSDSHWFVFSSRRSNGLYSQLFLASIDYDGNVTKAFLLPQSNPYDYYDGTTYSFNVPDFTSTRVSFDSHASVEEINSEQRVSTTVADQFSGHPEN